MKTIRVRKFTEINVKMSINPELFKAQRKFLTELICSAIDMDLIEYPEIELLQGLESLCDEIADQAHDNYGLDTLYTDQDGEKI